MVGLAGGEARGEALPRGEGRGDAEPGRGERLEEGGAGARGGCGARARLMARPGTPGGLAGGCVEEKAGRGDFVAVVGLGGRGGRGEVLREPERGRSWFGGTGWGGYC